MTWDSLNKSVSLPLCELGSVGWLNWARDFRPAQSSAEDWAPFPELMQSPVESSEDESDALWNYSGSSPLIPRFLNDQQEKEKETEKENPEISDQDHVKAEPMEVDCPLHACIASPSDRGTR